MLPHGLLRHHDCENFDHFHKRVNSKPSLFKLPESHLKKESDGESAFVRILRDCENLDYVHWKNYQALDPKARAFMPSESHEMIDKRGHGMTINIPRPTEVFPQVKVEESVRFSYETVPKQLLNQDNLDNFSSSCKRSRKMNPAMKQTAFPHAASSKFAEMEKLAHMLGGSGQTHMDMVPDNSIPFSPLDEPNPLGLTLRKTPSLVDLIQMKLAHNDLTIPQKSVVQASEMASEGSKTSGLLTIQQDKLKASNFPASILKIGTWECVSRYEGDLVAKCYFAKKKLVWEILENGLKSKIEIQWADISALKASCLNTEPGVLEIEVSQPPLFFKEMNPQPRKHTLWQATSDFTREQATICKRHYLKFSPGLLNRHYERLIHCDPRLKSLSERSLPSQDSDHFKQRGKNVLVQHEGKKFHQQDDGLHLLKSDSDNLKSYSSLPHVLGTAWQSPGTVTKLESRELDDRMSDILSSPSLSSGLDSQGYTSSSYTNSRDCFNVVDNSQPEYADHGKTGSRIWNQVSEPIHSQKPSICPLFAGEDANKHIFDELVNHLIEETPLQAFDEPAQALQIDKRDVCSTSNEQRQCSQLNLLSSDKKDIPKAFTSGLLSQAWPDESFTFQDHLRYREKELNVNTSSPAFGERRSSPKETLQISSGPNLHNVWCESYWHLLFNVPHINPLLELHEPALQGLNQLYRD